MESLKRPTNRGKLTHDRKTDQRETKKKRSDVFLHRVQVDAVGAKFEVDKDRSAGDDRQRVERVLRCQVHEPKKAAGRHAVHRTVGHPPQGEKPVLWRVDFNDIVGIMKKVSLALMQFFPT